LCDIRRLTCRPIVACTKFITTPLSQWIDAVLQPLIRQLPNVVKDTKSFINTIESLVIPSHYRERCVLFSADISSLYTNIPTDDGIARMTHFLHRPNSVNYLESLYPTVHIDTVIDTIISALSIVLTNNYLTFNGHTYLQKNGAAMGQSCAVVYAVIYVYELEQKLVKHLLHTGALLSYGRFIDDIFAVIVNNKISKPFTAKLNSMHERIKLTCVTSQNEVEFLDLVIFKGKRFRSSGIFDLRVHQKRTNRYLYIPFFSFHTRSCFIAFIHTELVRYIRGSSDFQYYLIMKILFYQRLRARGYPPKFLNEIMNTISYSRRSELLAERAITHNKDEYPLVFTSTYHPSVTHTQIKNALLKHWDVLISGKWNDDYSTSLSKIYTKPIVGYRRSQNIKELFTSSKYL
jgi:hypothetical protein